MICGATVPEVLGICPGLLDGGMSSCEREALLTELAHDLTADVMRSCEIADRVMREFEGRTWTRTTEAEMRALVQRSPL